MNKKILLLTLIGGSTISASAVTLVSGGGTIAPGITYTISGAVATQPDGAGLDLQTSVNTGGSFTITFTGGVVDLSFFNSETDQGVNFDGINPVEGFNVQMAADAGTWSYTGGAVLDLTNSTVNNSNLIVGLGTDTFTVGNTRGEFTGAAGAANSGAPNSEADWGTFSISGVSTVTYTFSNVTNFEGFRITAVAVPEPSSAALLGLCGLGLLARRRR
ncbi:MAG: PEP-CTERM sorting domain-containing protein [Akkermansiaceae bacterium]